MGISKADLRLVSLNDAMNLIQKEITRTRSPVLKEALLKLEGVKGGLIYNLDHDRRDKVR